MSEAHAARGHNLPPITPPTDLELLDDLKARFPELEKELAEFEAALKTYPKEFGLEDEEAAAALQDLLGKVKKHRSVIAAHKKTENSPWKKLVNVVINFFDTADEKLETITTEWLPRHQAYMDKVRAEKLRKQEEEAERQRAAEEASRKAAAEAEERRQAAERAEHEARQREEEARKRAEEEEARANAAREAARKAEEEEKQLAAEKRDRDRAEKEMVAESLRSIRRHMKDVEKLHEAAEGEAATDAQIEQLDAFIRPGGVVSALAGPVASSQVLDDLQKAEIEETRQRLAELRTAANDRFSAKERRKREKVQREADEREAADVERRRAARAAEQAEADAKRKERERLQAEEEDARARQKTAQGDVREARADARGAVSEQKGAAKEVRHAETEADRAANRADRIEYRLEKATDAEIAGTLRGELGTKGSLTRRWTLKIVDEEALRAVCGPLGPTFTEDALNGAAYRWMLNRMSGWSGRERVEGELAGVVFMYQQGARIS